MAKIPERISELDIRCPDCRKRFRVSDHIFGQMVECGACESRFQVTSEVLIKQKKTYPGERSSSGLSSFQQAPKSDAAVPANLETVRYEEFTHPNRVGPAAPQRVVASVAAVIIFIVVALLLMLGAFEGISVEKRVACAIFTALIGSLLLIYGTHQNRLKGLAASALLSLGLLSIPFLKKEPEFETAQELPQRSVLETETEGSAAPDPIAALHEKYLTEPLQKEQKRQINKDGMANAFGVYIAGLSPRYRYTVRDYLIRATKAGPSSHPYPRDDSAQLMVLTDVSKSLEDIGKIVAKIGTIEAIYPEIGLVVVKADNELFVVGSAEKLNNKSHPAFYELNHRELESIDLARVERAVTRLSSAPPILYRADITARLVELLAEPNVTFQEELATALQNWAEDPEAASSAAIDIIIAANTSDRKVPEAIVRLAVTTQDPRAAGPVALLWEQNPNLWGRYLAQLGNPAELLVLPKLSSEDGPLRRSAIKILGSIGSSASTPALEEFLNSPDPETRLLAQRSLSEINSR